MKGKHVEDVWTLASSLVKNIKLPRVLLKNGKRSREQFVQSQAVRRDVRQVRVGDEGGNVSAAIHTDGCVAASFGGATSDGDVANDVGVETAVVVPEDGGIPNEQALLSDVVTRRIRSSAGNSCEDVVFRASVVSELNMIRKEMSMLGQELRDLKSSMFRISSSTSASGKTCYVFVRFGCACDQLKIGKKNLEEVLHRKILHYTFVRWLPCSSFKVKIAAELLPQVLETGRSAGCFVDLWCNHGEKCSDDVRVSEGPRRCVKSDLCDHRLPRA